MILKARMLFVCTENSKIVGDLRRYIFPEYRLMCTAVEKKKQNKYNDFNFISFANTDVLFWYKHT